MFDYKAPKNLLDQRVILVTGASSGIGKDAAICYAQHGATVILLGRNEVKLEAVYDEIESQGLPQPAIYTLDLESAQAEDYDQLEASLEQEFDHVDGLLHNASLLGERKLLEQTSPASWQKVMQVNVNAPFMLTRALMPLMRQAQHASIIFTSSSVGRKGRAYWGSYAVSKFANEGMMEVLADELENVASIRVNSLNPGATNTSMRRAAYPAEEPTTNPSAEAIMPVYLYLMGDASIGQTGKRWDAQQGEVPQ